MLLLLYACFLKNNKDCDSENDKNCAAPKKETAPITTEEGIKKEEIKNKDVYIPPQRQRYYQ